MTRTVTAVRAEWAAWTTKKVAQTSRFRIQTAGSDWARLFCFGVTTIPVAGDSTSSFGYVTLRSAQLQDDHAVERLETNVLPLVSLDSSRGMGIPTFAR